LYKTKIVWVWYTERWSISILLRKKWWKLWLTKR